MEAGVVNFIEFLRYECNVAGVTMNRNPLCDTSQTVTRTPPDSNPEATQVLPLSVPKHPILQVKHHSENLPEYNQKQDHTLTTIATT